MSAAAPCFEWAFVGERSGRFARRPYRDKHALRVPSQAFGTEDQVRQIVQATDGVTDEFAERATRLRDKIVARLRTVASYRAGWDGERGAAPLRPAVNDAINLVANLSRDIPFTVSPSPDGAVNLACCTSAGCATLVFEGDRYVDIFISLRDGDYGDPVRLAVPSRIGADREIIRELSSIL